MKNKTCDSFIQISEHVYWVGTFDERDKFQCNPYLIKIDGKGVLIDPGSVLYFSGYLRKITDLIDLEQVAHVILQHQDPDVCGNIARLVEALRSSGNDRFTLITHRRTAALVRHYGDNLVFVNSDEFPNRKLELSKNHTLEFINTPYLHAPGAIATYFNTDKILFSSDIFGGKTDNWSIAAGDDYFEAIKQFHEEYMPSKEILLFTMTRFERYEIEKIAPQHGSVIDSGQARELIDLFKNFECGLFIDQSFRDELQAARKKIEEQNRIMNRELTMAGQFQKTLLPDTKKIEIDNHFDIAFFFEPHSQVSGDFLIIDSIDDRYLGVLVIDVVDHGVTSGLATIQVKTLFDAYKHTSFSPAEVLRSINDNAFSLAENDVFFSATYMIYDRDNSQAFIASAGGIPPIYYSSADDRAALLPIDGSCLGVFSGEDLNIGEKSLFFHVDDCLVIQTDGLMDTTNESDEPFEQVKDQKRFMDEIGRARPAQKILEGIVEKVNLHSGRSGHFDDDATIVVFKRRGE